MLHNITGWHGLIVLAVIVLLFGSTKLPQLARGMGQSIRIFRTETRDPVEPEDAAVAAVRTEQTEQDSTLPSPPAATATRTIPD